MLERAPPGFDERVRETHVDLSDDALQSAAIEERVHLVIEVLDAGGHEVTGRPGEHVVRVHPIEAAATVHARILRNCRTPSCHRAT